MSMTKHNTSRRPVVGIKVVGQSAKREDASDDRLLAGDIVEQVDAGGVTLSAPFAGGKTGLQLELRRLFHAGDSQVQVKVRRLGDKHVNLHTSIVPYDASMLKKQYALKAINDPTHLATFTDSSEAESFAIQEKRHARVTSQLGKIHLQQGYVPYPWEKKTKQQEVHSQRSNAIFSLLVIPSSRDKSLQPHNDVEDILSKALTWLAAAQASGAPISFLNIQTESLITKVSGQEASVSTIGPDSWEANATGKAVYGYEDYHGIDLGVLRAVRLWYVPAVSEVSIVLSLQKGESRLGLGIGRTEEGFCYVSSVEDGTVASRSGLKMILLAAQIAGKHVVISRIGNEKITPTMVSSTGSICCYDTGSISQKLSMHRMAGRPLTLCVLVCEGAMLLANTGATTGPGSATSSIRDSNASTIEDDSKRFSSNSRSVMLEVVSDPNSGRSSNASLACANLTFSCPQVPLEAVSGRSSTASVVSANCQ